MKRCPVCDTAYPTHKARCDVHQVLLVDSNELEPGEIVRDKYKIIGSLGRGGMGVVYQGQNILDGRMRALKFLRADLALEPKARARFIQEATIELRHPNIVHVYDTEQAENGAIYIVMEYVKGHSLASELKGRHLPVERALAIARGVAEGLAFAHAVPLVHRDVKPDNIMLANGQIPMLMDFGIAALRERGVGVTTTQGPMMTPLYASPEQCRGLTGTEVDCRVDLYSLGCVLYEMLTGRPPFDAPTSIGLAEQHLRGERIPPSRLRPELAQWAGLDALVLRLLAVEREQRPASAGEFLQYLDTVQLKPRTTVREQVRETVVGPGPSARRQPKTQVSEPKPTTSDGLAGRIVEKSDDKGQKLAGASQCLGRIMDGRFCMKHWLSFSAAVGPLGILVFAGLMQSNSDPEPFRYFFAISDIGCSLVMAVGIAGLVRAWRRLPGLLIRYQPSFNQSSVRSLFDALTSLGYGKPVNGVRRPMDVYLTRVDQAPVLSFIVKEGSAMNTQYIQSFAAITRKIAPALGGLPLMMQLASTKCVVRKRFLVY